MLTYQSHFINELKKLITEEMQRVGDIVVNPNNSAIQDYAQYRFQVGVVQGLRTVLELCDEAEARADGRKKGGK